MRLPFYTSFRTFLSIFIVLLTGATLYAVDSMDLKKLKAGECEGCDLKFAQLQGLEMLGVNLFEANLQKANLVGSKLAGARLLSANLVDAKLREASLIHA